MAGLLALAAVAVGVASLGGDGEGERAARSQEPSTGRERSGAAQDRSSGDRAAPTPEPAPAEEAAPPEEPASGEPAPEEPAGDSAEQPAGDPAALNAQGKELLDQGRYDEAIPPLQRAVDSYGPAGSSELTYAYALFNLAQSLRLAGRPDEAIPLLERRLAIPNQTKAVEKELKAAQKAAR